ncbi:hypothetical protein G7Z17_g10914 [Cylindrodendrum hubeiense]|uniref:Uncharacterized protein n=1 Tax=Cylindrodendrum hubeiense TaxID=595255 RepID=A0A9P5H669_9HYPO|nr:hypothetical protein G7Z17_g10914 [Cylindrodendrum hubeiense]
MAELIGSAPTTALAVPHSKASHPASYASPMPHVLSGAYYGSPEADSGFARQPGSLRPKPRGYQAST